LRDRLGFSPIQTKRVLDNLRNEGLISGLYANQRVWTMDKEHKKRIDNYVSRMNDEVNTILMDKVIKKKNTRRKRKFSANDVLAKFKELYEEIYEEEIPHMSRYKTMPFCKRPLTWTNGDFAHVCEVLEFLFYEWEKVKQLLRLKDKRSSLSHIATAGIWQKLREFCVLGFDDSIKDRVVHSEDSEVGW